MEGQENFGKIFEYVQHFSRKFSKLWWKCSKKCSAILKVSATHLWFASTRKTLAACLSLFLVDCGSAKIVCFVFFIFLQESQIWALFCFGGCPLWNKMAAAIDFLMSYYYAIFLLWLIICPSMKVAMTFWTDFERYFFCSLFNVLKIVTRHHLGTLIYKLCDFTNKFFCL